MRNKAPWMSVVVSLVRNFVNITIYYHTDFDVTVKAFPVNVFLVLAWDESHYMCTKSLPILDNKNNQRWIVGITNLSNK